MVREKLNPNRLLLIAGLDDRLKKGKYMADLADANQKVSDADEQLSKAQDEASKAHKEAAEAHEEAGNEDQGES